MKKLTFIVVCLFAVSMLRAEVNSIGLPSTVHSANVGHTGQSYENADIQNFMAASYLRVDSVFDAFPSSSVSEGCPGDAIAVSANASGGVGSYLHEWSPINNFSNPFSASSNFILPDTSGAYTVSVQITDEDNNVISRTLTVDINGVHIDAGADQMIACGTTANLEAMASGYTSGAYYNWNNGVDTAVNSGVAPGKYSVTVTNDKGCSDKDVVEVSYQNVSQVIDFEPEYHFPYPAACVCAPLIFTNTSSALAGWYWIWDFDDPANTLSISQSPTFTYASAGTYSVTLTADSADCSLSISKTVQTVNCDSGGHGCWDVGISGATDAQTISIYPNPATGQLFVDVNSLVVQEIVLSDLVGRTQLTTKNVQRGINGIDVSHLQPGIYFVNVKADEGIYTGKVMIMGK